MTFISNRAYCETSIFSTSYLTSACNSIKVVSDNLIAYSVVTGTVNVVTLLGCVIISVTTTFVMNWTLEYASEQHNMLIETYSPQIFIFLVSMLIAKMFMFVYDASCESLLHCMYYDQDNNYTTEMRNLSSGANGGYEKLNKTTKQTNLGDASGGKQTKGEPALKDGVLKKKGCMGCPWFSWCPTCGCC